jgi:hypothetical protein
MRQIYVFFHLPLPFETLIGTTTSSHFVPFVVAITKLLFCLNLLTAQPSAELNGYV